MSPQYANMHTNPASSLDGAKALPLNNPPSTSEQAGKPDFPTIPSSTTPTAMGHRAITPQPADPTADAQYLDEATTTEQQDPLSNFNIPECNTLPGPLEVRLEIMKHLLDGAFIKPSSRPASSAPGEPGGLGPDESFIGSAYYRYKFQTNVLSVSKDFAADANDILMKKNKFVLVTVHGYTSWKHVVHSFGVPVVCEDSGSLQDFHHWIMKVNIREPKKDGECLLSHELHDAHVPYAKRTMLLLAQDLPSFCEAWGWYCRSLRYRFDVVTTTGELEPAAFHEERMSLSIKFQAVPSRGRPLTPEEQRDLLAPFRKCVLPGQEVSVSVNSECLEADVNNLFQTISPTKGYEEAMAWDMLDATKAASDTARGLFEEGHYECLEDLVDVVISTVDNFFVNTTLAKQSHCEHLLRIDAIVSDLQGICLLERGPENREAEIKTEFAYAYKVPDNMEGWVDKEMKTLMGF